MALHRLILPADPAAEKTAGEYTRPERKFSLFLAVFALGLVIGLGLASGLGREFFAGLVMLSVLTLVLARLGRLHEDTRKRVTAGEASYRAFFDHAVEGIFRTTPDGHYLAVNQALAEIYGYASPEDLCPG